MFPVFSCPFPGEYVNFHFHRYSRYPSPRNSHTRVCNPVHAGILTKTDPRIAVLFFRCLILRHLEYMDRSTSASALTPTTPAVTWG